MLDYTSYVNINVLYFQVKAYFISIFSCPFNTAPWAFNKIVKISDIHTLTFS